MVHFVICNLRLHQNKFNFLTIMARNSSSRILNVAEKNDAAKRISDLLSNRQYTWVSTTGYFVAILTLLNLF